MFGKHPEKPGLYRGDDPVTVPGHDGAGPTAYRPPRAPTRPRLTGDDLVAEVQRMSREIDDTLKETGYDPPAPPAKALQRLRRQRLLVLTAIVVVFGLPALLLIFGFVASLFLGK